jgi:GAF domain-containing protein
MVGAAMRLRAAHSPKDYVMTPISRSLAQKLRDCTGLQMLLDYSLAHCLDLCGTEFGNIQLINWKRGYLEIKSQYGFRDEFLTFFKRVTAKEGSACARALRTLEPVVIEDVMVDDDFAPYRSIAYESGFRAVQSTPVVSSRGATLGILSTHFATPHQPNEKTMDAVKDVARLIADSIIFHRARKYSMSNGGDDMPAILSRSHKLIEESYRAMQKADHAMLRPFSR